MVGCIYFCLASFCPIILIHYVMIFFTITATFNHLYHSIIVYSFFPIAINEDMNPSLGNKPYGLFTLYSVEASEFFRFA